MAGNKERTFIMIKPDGVQRGLIGKIIQRFEQKGFSLVAMKMLWVSDDFTIFSRLSNDDRSANVSHGPSRLNILH